MLLFLFPSILAMSHETLEFSEVLDWVRGFLKVHVSFFLDGLL
jgi:hypothetical protein